ncbi:hypothetical protein V3N99_14245 [Dermatophilaceae bacterium Soc4.6]
MSDAPRRAPRSRSSTADPSAAVAALAMLVLGSLVVLLASVAEAGSLPVLLAATAVGALAVAWAGTDRGPVRPLPAPLHPSGVARSVPASTAYWCAVAAPRCPRRPRAPGRG